MAVVIVLFAKWVGGMAMPAMAGLLIVIALRTLKPDRVEMVWKTGPVQQVVMGVTGFIMWFPLLVTAILPGQVFAVAQALHRWEAILAVLAILTWHMYHGCIKDGNRSIFTGLMSEEEMQHMHPLEYQRILAADAYLKKMAAVDGLPRSETVVKEKIEHGVALGLSEVD